LSIFFQNEQLYNFLSSILPNGIGKIKLSQFSKDIDSYNLIEQIYDLPGKEVYIEKSRPLKIKLLKNNIFEVKILMR